MKHLADPIARQTDWTSMSALGANFRTRKLVKRNSGRMEFQPTLETLAFCLLLFGVGIGIVVWSMIYKYEMDIALLYFGVPFVAGGCIMLYSYTAPIVFDEALGYFWRGWTAPNRVVDTKTLKDCAELSEIHALQLLSGHKGGKGQVHFYQLNIILKTAARINVVTHGNRKALQADAQSLSAFLGTPVWDAISVHKS